MKIDFSTLTKLDQKQFISGCFSKDNDSPIGKKLELYTDRQSLFTQLIPKHNHLGWGDLVHGGVFMTILDELMGMEAVFVKGMICVTREFTSQFKLPSHISDTFTFCAKAGEIDISRITIHGSVFNSGNIECVTAKATYNAINAKKAEALKITNSANIHRLISFTNSLKKT
jgi:acyl-coenzyme A thioesterase PaaI-like protein